MKKKSGRSLKGVFLKSCLRLTLCVWLIFSLSACSKKEDKQGPLALAPDFTLKTLEDQEISLSGLRGKAVLLDFWATWCSPCREAIPHLVQLYERYRGNGFEVIGMAMDRGDTDRVHRFVKALGVPYPVVMAPDDLVRKYGVASLPTTILIDQDGKIRHRVVGFSSPIAKQLQVKVEELTSKTP